MKNTVEVINSRINDTEEWIHYLDDWVVEIINQNSKKKKKILLKIWAYFKGPIW